MTSFSVARKKTPFQKHREEEEAKKKREDEEAARLYEEFVESFKSDDVPGGKAFVRGGLIDPNDRTKPSTEGAGSKEGATVSKKPGSRYVPSFIPPGLAALVNKGKDSDKEKEEGILKERERSKSRNIDHFMEELKAEQEIREKRIQEREHRNRDGKQIDNLARTSRFDELPEELDPGKVPGSIDEGDPQTTNLYVGNLSPQVDENFLLRTFGRFGPIASVKIMWPRTEEERRRQRNCGFVAFMNRSDAQAAKDEMEGVVIYEYDVRIGWGKAVALPAQSLPAPPPGQMAVRAKEGSKANVAWSGPKAPTAPVSSHTSEVVVTPNVPDIEVVPPKDKHIQHVIDTMAMYVLDDGCDFEQAIMERGRGNSLFDFLFDLGSKEHTYYVWRLYSFAQGDTLQRWRTEPFIMITGSGRWVPPDLPVQAFGKSPEHEKGLSATHAAGRGRRVEQERALTDAQRDEFEDMLRALTLERSLIKEAMGFALDNADAAGEVVEVLTESLTLKETLIPAKVARLMLVSDVLHNSSAPVKNASAYRTKLEACLPDIMESFNEVYKNITGRITAEALKERILKVLKVWSDWFLFSDAYVTGLRATFLRPGNSGVPPFHSLCGDAPPLKEMKVEEGGGSEFSEGMEVGQNAALAIGEGAAVRELSTLPLSELERRCKHNGLSIRGGREVMVARLLSLEEAERQKNKEYEVDFRIGYQPPGMGKLSTSNNDGMHKPSRNERWASGGDRTESIIEWRENASNEAASQSDRETTFQSMQNVRHSSADVTTVTLEHETLVDNSGTHGLPASKWIREDDGSDDEMIEKKGLGLSYSSSESEDGCSNSRKNDITPVTRNEHMDEETRQKLRWLELALMEYRESLESHGVKNKDEIEKKVSLQRQKLEIDYKLADVRAKGDMGLEKYSAYVQERIVSNRKDQRADKRDSSQVKKRSHSQSGSRSPQLVRGRSSRDREIEKRLDRNKEQDTHGGEKHSRDGDDYDGDREKHRERIKEREDGEKRTRRS